MVMVSHPAQPSLFAHAGRFLPLIETRSLSKSFGGLRGASAGNSERAKEVNFSSHNEKLIGS
jgi:hypothetical protein